MKKILLFMLFAIISISVTYSQESKKANTKKKGVVSKVGDAATRGYGWQLGKEAAKETIKGAKKISNSESMKKLKEKTKESATKIKEKVKDGVK